MCRSKSQEMPSGSGKWLFLELVGDVERSQSQIFFFHVRLSINPEFDSFSGRIAIHPAKFSEGQYPA